MNGSAFLLPVWDTISEGWDKTKGAKASVWAAVFILALILFGFYLIQLLINNAVPQTEGVVSFIFSLISYPFEIGILYIGIRRAQDLPFNFRNMFRPIEGNIWLKLIGFYILQTLILLPIIIVIVMVIVLSMATQPDNQLSLASGLTWISILVAIIGGLAILYLIIRMWLGPAFIMDRDAGPWQGIKLSFRATRSNFWRLLGFFLLMLIIMIISMIPLLIGLIWTIPFGNITYGVAYKKLLANVS